MGTGHDGHGDSHGFLHHGQPEQSERALCGYRWRRGVQVGRRRVSWNPIGIDPTVLSIIVDPADSNMVYAGSNGNGVYKSTDGGATFVRVGSPREGVVLSLALSGGRLYAGTATEGVSVSEDGGATWRNTGAADGLALGLSVDSAGAVYLATNFEGAFVLPAAVIRTASGKRRMPETPEATTDGAGWPGSS